ncbi:C2 family cysteine protease [Spirillospora sp. NPDC049652]
MTEQQTGSVAPRGRWRVRDGSYAITARRSGSEEDTTLNIAEFAVGEVGEGRAKLRVVRSGADWGVASLQVTIAEKDLPALAGRSVKEPDLLSTHDGIGGYFAPDSALFPSAPHPSDVAQGLVGDCRVASAFQALAASKGGPALIQSLITTTEGGYNVRLVPTTGPKALPASGARPETMTISRHLPVSRHNRDPLYLLSGSPYGPTSTTPLWPAVLEKAFATMWGGYAALDGAEERPVLAALGLGDFVHVNWMSDEETKPAVAKAKMPSLAADGYAITTAARGKRHNYAVLAAGEDGVLVSDPNTPRGGDAEKRWKSATLIKNAEKLPGSDEFPLLFTWDAFFQAFMWFYAARPPAKK